jgi:ACS family hexuronate transporter-like MFS transporter
MAVSMAFSGQLSDRMGKNVAISSGFTILSVGIFLGGYSVGYATLLICLFIVGVGAGVFIVAIYAYAGDVMPSSRNTLIGITNSLYALGGLVGSWTLAILTMKFGWRSPFNLVGILALVVSVLLWRFFGFKHSVNEIKDRSVEKRWDFLNNRHVVFLCAGIAVANFAFVAFTAWAPTYLVRVWSFDLSEAGFAFGLYALSGVLGATFFGILADKISRTVSILTSGFLSFILGLLYFSGYLGSTSLIVLSGMFGFTSFAYWNLAISAVQDCVEDTHMGSATGITQGIATLSGAVAPTVSGFMITNCGFNSALILSIALPELIYVALAWKATQ